MAAKDKAAAENAAEFAAEVASLPANEQEIVRALERAVAAHAPHLEPRLWYKMPAWARDGKTVFFFQSSFKFKTRYCTLGFSDTAALDADSFWPSAFAITGLTPELEEALQDLIGRAAK